MSTTTAESIGIMQVFDHKPKYKLKFWPDDGTRCKARITTLLCVHQISLHSIWDGMTLQEKSGDQ